MLIKFPFVKSQRCEKKTVNWFVWMMSRVGSCKWWTEADSWSLWEAVEWLASVHRVCYHTVPSYALSPYTPCTSLCCS